MRKETISFSLVVAALSCVAAVVVNNPSGGGGGDPGGTNVIHTNILWVTKNGNNGTAAPGNSAKPYLTISNAVQAAVAPAEVRVAPGTYTDRINLKNGVNIYLSEGVIIDVVSTAISDNSVAVTNSILGRGIIRSVGGFAVRLPSSSKVFMEVNYIDADDPGFNGAVSLDNGSQLTLTGDIYSGDVGINANGNSSALLNFQGRVVSTNDYGIVLSSSGTNYISGSVFSILNSAISPTGSGFTLVENCDLLSSNLYAVEVAGGDIEIKGTKLRSLRDVDGSGNAISKYAGNLLVLDDVQMIPGPNNNYCIDNQGSGSHGSIQIRGPCWSTVIANPAMNITLGGILASNVWMNKAPLTLSAATRTNMVLATNGNVSFHNTITAPTNTASFDFITTNLLTGQTYTNLSQRGHVVATIAMTNILAGDVSAMSLIVDQDANGTWDTTNGPVRINGVALSAGEEQLFGLLQPGALFAFTNQSAGTSPSVSIRSGSCQWSRW